MAARPIGGLFAVCGSSEGEAIGLSPKCARCDDTFWVCEAHSDVPSDYGPLPRARVRRTACTADWPWCSAGLRALVAPSLPPNPAGKALKDEPVEALPLAR